MLQGQACQQNGFEHLAFLAAAIVRAIALLYLPQSSFPFLTCTLPLTQLTGIVAHIPGSTLNNIALFYLGTRIAYVYLYLTIHYGEGLRGLWRTLAFNSGYLSLVYIFFRA